MQSNVVCTDANILVLWGYAVFLHISTSYIVIWVRILIVTFALESCTWGLSSVFNRINNKFGFNLNDSLMSINRSLSYKKFDKPFSIAMCSLIPIILTCLSDYFIRVRVEPGLIFN